MKGPIYIISGGAGASGDQVVQTVLAQFPEVEAQIERHPNVRDLDQIRRIVEDARRTDGTIVHTLVDSKLRRGLIELAVEFDVTAIDLMGPLIDRLAEVFGQPPAEHPGLYRQLNKTYFERVAAIDFAMAYDDGKNPQGWKTADILLLGVSRSGKTPICLYLSVLGIKAANYPLVPGVEPPHELFEQDPARVIGLHIEAGQLLLHRQLRQKRMGTMGLGDYVNPSSIADEVTEAQAFYRRYRFSILDVTDKTIEACADEIIRLIRV